MSTPIIPPTPATPSSGQASVRAALDVDKPAGTTTIDDAMAIEVESLAQIAASKLAGEVADRVFQAQAKTKTKTKTILYLDAKAVSALSLYRTFELQCTVLSQGFASASTIADKAFERLKYQRATPQAGKSIKNATEATQPQGVGPLGLIPTATLPATLGLTAAANLLGFFSVDTEYRGRAASVSEQAFVFELARCLQKKQLTFWWPSLTFVLEFPAPPDDNPPDYLKRMNNVTDAASKATTAIANLATFVNNLPDNDPRFPVARDALDRAHRFFDSSSAIYDDLRRRFLAQGSAPETTLGELIQLGSRLKASAGTDHMFLAARVEKAGGSYRIRKHMWQALTGEPPLTFTGGCIVSFALLDKTGAFLESGTVHHRLGYRSHPGSWDTANVSGEDNFWTVLQKALFRREVLVPIALFGVLAVAVSQMASRIDSVRILLTSTAAAGVLVGLIARSIRGRRSDGSSTSESHDIEGSSNSGRSNGSIPNSDTREGEGDESSKVES